MKKNTATHPSLELETPSKSWEEHPLVEKLSSYGLTALIALFVLIVASFLAYKITSMSTEKAEINYLTANKDFLLFSQPASAEADPAVNGNALNDLQKLLVKYPELNAKYDALIAQTLLNRNNVAEAQTYANQAIARTEAINRPFYTEYAKNSLLIGQKQYANALTEAKNLDKQMRDALVQNPNVDQTDFGGALFGLNLLRIAALQQQLGAKQDELQTWQDWKEFSKADKFPALAKAFQDLRTQFNEGKVSLNDYAESRIAVLKSK